jgi:hypothetical protein
MIPHWIPRLSWTLLRQLLLSVGGAFGGGAFPEVGLDFVALNPALEYSFGRRGFGQVLMVYLSLSYPSFHRYGC